ncbi:MAG: peptidoglycan bridge formation glycyltransferase FemA/FemB family protein [Acidobacteriota bacterium]|jgi:hypothetical protein
MAALRYRTLDDGDRPALDSLLSRAPMGTVFADPDWMPVLEQASWTARPVAVEKDGDLRACALLGTRRVPVSGWRFQDLHGSLVGLDAEAIRYLLAGIVGEARQAGVLRVRVSVKYPAADLAERIGASLRDLLPASPDRSHTSEDLGTYWLDLREEAGWAPEAWSANKRRDLRKGEREGVEVRSGEEPGDLERFERIYRATYARKGLETKREGYFEALRPLFRRGRIALFFAWYGGDPVAATMLGVGTISRYLLGGTVDVATPVPPTGPGLQYAMMRHAAAQGAEYYDFGGAPGPEPVKGHPNFGVWRFKRGFNGRYVKFEDEYDLVLRPLRERLVEAALGLRSRAGG